MTSPFALTETNNCQIATIQAAARKHHMLVQSMDHGIALARYDGPTSLNDIKLIALGVTHKPTFSEAIDTYYHAMFVAGAVKAKHPVCKTK